MNLSKLFEIQAKLDERIVQEHNLQGQDLLDKKILALQVELGECANEWRGFKFWSKDQELRTKSYSHHEEKQHRHNGFSSIAKYDKNPLLEEYVDCLHFILSIGLEMQFGNYPTIGNAPKTKTVTDMFLVTFESINNFYRARYSSDESLTEIRYTIAFDCFLTLGEMLGFTTEQIEQAYQDKNKINHERQANGY